MLWILFFLLVFTQVHLYHILYYQVYNDALDSADLIGTFCGSSQPYSIFTGVQ